MKKVYIVNKGGHSFEDAKRYGDLVTCTSGTQNRFSVNAMYRGFVESMEGSRGDDYILLTSLNILCAIACAVFARKHGRLNILLYKNGKYVARELMIDELLETVEPFGGN